MERFTVLDNDRHVKQNAQITNGFFDTIKKQPTLAAFEERIKRLGW